MKTPEEYAKRFFGGHDHWIRIPACMEDGTVFEAMFQSMQFGDRGEIASDCRAALANLIRRVIEEAHAAWMANVPGGISGDRLKEVTRVVASDKGWYDGYLTQTGSVCSSDDILLRAYEDRRDLLAHIQHQAALIEDIAQLSSEYTEARERIRKSARTEGWSARLHAFMRRKQPVRRFLTTRAPFALTWNASWIPFCLCLIRHPDPTNHLPPVYPFHDLQSPAFAGSETVAG